MVPYEDLKLVNQPFFEQFLQKFRSVSESGWYILGEQVKQFEAEFASYHKAENCIGVANGLDALILSLKAYFFKPGTEVIVPSNTYIATILAVLHAGLVPVLVEPDVFTYNIDATKLESAINEKTRAIMVVHLYGKCCDMDPIIEICKKNDLILIEDCAQAHGGKYKGKLSGTFGDCAGFSFYPTKNLGALGDAGAVICKDASIAEIIYSFRNYGSKKKYFNDHIGYNSRLDEFQAAFLLVKLEWLDKINTHKRKLASLYHQHLKEEFMKPIQSEDFYDVYHIFPVRHQKRNELKEYLLENKIMTEIHYPVPPHQQPALKFLSDQRFPISEEIHRTILSLPCSFAHTEEQILNVIEVMNRF